MVFFHYQFLFQANCTLEFTLHMEKQAICLKQNALQLYNVALAGTTTGKILDLMESCYGYEETEASVAEGLHLETIEHYLKEDDDENLPDHALPCKGDESPIIVPKTNTPIVEPLSPDAPVITPIKPQFHP